MKQSKFSEEQIHKAIQQVEAGRESRWASASTRCTPGEPKYGGLAKDDLKKVKDLEEENRRLKQSVADLSLDWEALKWVIEQRWECAD